MKIFLFFFMVYVTTSYTNANGRDDTKPSDPLPILYHPLQRTYTISDIDLVEKMISKEIINGPSFSLILLHCGHPTKNSILKEFQFSNKMTLPSTTDSVLGLVSCDTGYQLHITLHAEMYMLYSFGIGYAISNQSKQLIEDYDLPLANLYNSFRDSGVMVIWYSSPDPNYQYLHRFQNYKPALLPDTSCEKYHFIVEKHKEKYDINNEEYFHPTKQDEVFKRYHRDTQKNNEHFARHQMVPIDDFIEHNRRVVACGGFNYAPIWQSVSTGPIRKIEAFIRKIAEKVYDDTLFVRTETYKQLKWRSIDENKLTNVFLDNNKKIPVPKYYLKIVCYRIPFPIPQVETTAAPEYCMVIVVNNGFPASEDRLCNKDEKDICHSYGWDEVIDENENGLVYCCQPEDADVEKMLFYIHKNRKSFDLHNVVTHKHTNGNILQTMDIIKMLNENNSEKEPQTEMMSGLLTN